MLNLYGSPLYMSNVTIGQISKIAMDQNATLVTPSGAVAMNAVCFFATALAKSEG